MERNVRRPMPMDCMTANSRRRKARLFVRVLNTLAMAMSTRMTLNSKLNRRTMDTRFVMDTWEEYWFDTTVCPYVPG